MTDARKPTYDQLSALCAQMAAALKFYRDGWQPTSGAYGTKFSVSPDLLNDYGHRAQLALTAYRTLSPDPQWQRVPEGCVVVPKKSNAAIATAMGDVMDKQDADSGVVCWYTVGEECWAAGIKAAANRARGEG